MYPKKVFKGSMRLERKNNHLPSSINSNMLILRKQSKTKFNTYL